MARVIGCTTTANLGRPIAFQLADRDTCTRYSTFLRSDFTGRHSTIIAVEAYDFSLNRPVL